MRLLFANASYQLPTYYPPAVVAVTAYPQRMYRRAGDDRAVSYFVAAVETILAWPYDEKGVVLYAPVY